MRRRSARLVNSSKFHARGESLEHLLRRTVVVSIEAFNAAYPRRGGGQAGGGSDDGGAAKNLRVGLAEILDDAVQAGERVDLLGDDGRASELHPVQNPLLLVRQTDPSAASA